MITAHDLILDQFDPDEGSDKRLTTWYAQGQSDAIGDRLLMFDNTNLPSWEILRFRPALAHNPRFEAAVRQRVEQLIGFQHDSFPLVRPIKRLGHDDGLAVVSTYSSGASLSEALKKPRSVEFALRLIRQLVPALAALQRHGITHGALTPDRIILNAEGRLVIREHMVGSALESLELPSARLWSEFGVLAPPTATVTATLDERCDVAQLALIAVSLMAGRRIAYEEYPDGLHAVLDEIALRHQGPGPVRFQNLRRWLERALRLGNEPFDTAHEAEAALAGLQDEPERSGDHVQETLPTVPKEVPAKEDRPADVVGCPASARASDPSCRARGAGTPWCRAPVARRSANVDSLGHRGHVCRGARRGGDHCPVAARSLDRCRHRRCQGGHSAAARGDPADRAAAPGAADRRHDRNGRSNAPRNPSGGATGRARANWCVSSVGAD